MSEITSLGNDLGSLQKEVESELHKSVPLYSLTKRKAWPSEEHSLTTITYTRESGSELSYKKTEVHYGLQQMIFKSPPCEEGKKIFIQSCKFAAFNRMQDSFLLNAGHKISLCEEFPRTGSGYDIPQQQPTRHFSDEILDVILKELEADSAPKPEKGFILYASEEALSKASDTEDFQKIVNTDPARFILEDGEIKRVPKYLHIHEDGFHKAQVNPQFRDAPYEASIIFHEDVQTMLVNDKILGDANPSLSFVTIVENPCGDIVGFSCNGFQPKRTEWGYVIIHLRNQ